MIASVRGTVIDKALDHVVVEAAGVGHLITCPPRTVAELPRGEEVLVLTELVVREDAMTLYGFGSSEEREMFRLLQTVSKLGPKIALALLEILPPQGIAAAIAGSDVRALSRATGVGKRMAERIVLELKEKVGAFAAPAGHDGADAAAPAAAAPAGGAEVDRVVEALAGLGFGEREATGAVESVLAADPSADASSALRQALKALGRG
ncbi:Holliday junction branch migration protein RuvA [Corynebacterium sp. 335C]